MKEKPVSRRRFLGLGAAVGIVSTAVPLLSSCGENLPEVKSGRAIVGENELKPNSAFVYADAESGDARVLVRKEEGDFALYSAECTHNGCTVDYWAEERCFACPCHNSVFDLEDGSVVSGPADEPLPRLAVRVENGKVVSA